MLTESDRIDVDIRHDISIPFSHHLYGLKTIQSVMDVCTHSDKSFYKKKSMGYYAKGDGKVRNYIVDKESNLLRVPRGKMSQLRSILKEDGVPYNILDNRLSKPIPSEIELKYNIKLWDYQVDLFNVLYKRQNCLIRGGCGSGKTEIANKLIEVIRENTLVIVWSESLYNQWIERICNRFSLDESDIGKINSKEVTLKPITVAMQQTLHKRLQTDKYRDAILNYFGCIICDEVQRFAATTMYNSVYPFPAKYRIGISEDETRKDGQEYLIYDLFGDVAREISSDELVEYGVSHSVPIYVVPSETRSYGYENPGYKCNRCKAKYGADDIIEDRDTLEIRYFKVGDLCNNPRCRGTLLSDKDYDCAVQSIMEDSDRLDIIGGLVNHHNTLKDSALLFSDRVEYCEQLKNHIESNGVPAGLIVGDPQYKKEREETERNMKSGELCVAIGTSTVYQGLDIPHLNVGIVTIPKGTNRQLLSQQMGRMRRPERNCHKCGFDYEIKPGDITNGELKSKCPNCGVRHKTEARLYYIWDRHLFPNHIKNLSKWFKDVYVLCNGVYKDASEYIKAME